MTRSKIAFELPGTATAFDADYEAVALTLARRDRLDKQITAMAVNSEFTPVVRRLCCLRGVPTLTGFAVAVEIGDWTRFSGASIGAYLGLTPSEHSSGESRRQGGITKTGNTTPAGCSSRPPGTTNPATGSAPPCKPAGTPLRPRPSPRPRR